MDNIPIHEYTPGGAPRRSGLFRRILRPLALFAAVIAGAGIGLFSYHYFDSKTFQDTVNTVVTRTDTPDKAFPEQHQVNILLMGRDLDRDRHGRIVNTRGRTDTMMLAHVDFQNNTCNILSLPRDTLVSIPGYRGKRRISYANALGGPELATQTVAEFLGVEPDYFLLVNFDGFEKAIDAVGGLEITVDKKLDYDDNWGNLHIHLEPGHQLLDGEQAMGFVRYRQSNDGDSESDLVRIGRQQELLRSVGERLSTPGVMFRIPKLLDIIRDDIEGNLSPAQMICLARFLKSIHHDSGIRMETLPALDGGGVFVRADLDATGELVRQMFFDNQQ